VNMKFQWNSVEASAHKCRHKSDGSSRIIGFKDVKQRQQNKL